jgi:hypothetical protein
MELTPQSEQSFRDPTPEMPRVMQLHMTPDAQRDQQRLRVLPVPMVDNEPSWRSACATLEPVTLKNQIP